MFGIKPKRRIEQLEKELRLQKQENETILNVSDKVNEAYKADVKKLNERIDKLNRENEDLKIRLNESMFKIMRVHQERDSRGRFARASVK